MLPRRSSRWTARSAGPVALTCVVVGLVTVAGVYWGAMDGRTGYADAVIQLGPPTYFSLVCTPSGSGPVYFLNIFPIEAIRGAVTTADFGLGIETGANRTFEPQGLAPAPSPNLPCGVPNPKGWYAILNPDRVNETVLTYPVPDPLAPGGVGWANSSVGGTPVPRYATFILVTGGDVTGLGDRLYAFGIDGSTVTLTGNTTFPSYHNP